MHVTEFRESYFFIGYFFERSVLMKQLEVIVSSGTRKRHLKHLINNLSSVSYKNWKTVLRFLFVKHCNLGMDYGLVI